MIKFLKIRIVPEFGIYENVSYIPDIIRLVKAYGNKLFDDYFLDSGENITKVLIALIQRTSPCFWVIASSDGEFRGFVYLDDWLGSSKRSHSASVTTCIDPKYWGKFTRFAGKRFIKYVFKRYKLVKLKAEVYRHNRNAINLLQKLGFKKECTLKSETMVGLRPVDIDVYSIIKVNKRMV